MVSIIWGICFSLKANPGGSNAKILTRFWHGRPTTSVASPRDSSPSLLLRTHRTAPLHKAAVLVYVAQSALRQQIKQLEDELGTRRLGGPADAPNGGRPWRCRRLTRSSSGVLAARARMSWRTDARSDWKALARGLLVALVLFFVVMFLVLRVLYAILGIVRALALLRFLILLAVFILRFALLVLCHRGLRMIDTVFCANVTRKKSPERK